jgi:hypothetical protein
VKLNEFKKVKIDEVDTSSLFGNYGSAALRTGAKSLFGKSTLSTQDQIAKDQFVKSFMSKAAIGLQDAIRSGWVDQGGANQSAANVNPNPNVNSNPNVNTQQGQGATVNPADAIAQKRIAAQKAQADAIREPGASEGPKYNIDPNKQMSPFSKLPSATPKTPEQIRQEKLAAATQSAQGQMTPKAPDVAVDTPKTPEQIRQEKLAAATQSAQGQMNPVSNLPADQFAKSASNVRQQQQNVATQNAQGEMLPVSTLPTDQFNKSATNVRQRKQSNATKSVKNPKDNTITMPNRNVKPRNAGKNAFGQMTQNLGKVAEGSRFDKLNYIFESILAEAEQGDTQTSGVAKKSISQWVVDFFKKFMKGEDITSDPTIMQNVTALSKELEQNYTKDKGKTTIPKLADLAWSATHAPGEKDISQDQPEKTEKTNKTGGQGAAGTGGGGGGATNIYNVFGQGAGSPQDAQKAKSAYQQIQSLLKDLTPANKQKILTSLQKELANAPAKKTTPTTTPTGDTSGTYNKKTGAAKLGGKSMVAATDLPPNIQKQLQQK